MLDILQEWLATKLGVVLDMSPAYFGRNTQDGVILAKVLKNYGIIDNNILACIKAARRQGPCYENLLKLKPYLDALLIPCNDSTLREMACGQGTAALHLFYSVYLNLESKDRLHHLAHKPADCSMIKLPHEIIKATCDEEAGRERTLATPLAEAQHIMQWHRSKCNELINQIKKGKRRYNMTVGKLPKSGLIIHEHRTSQPLEPLPGEVERTQKALCDFQKKHKNDPGDMTYGELVEMELEMKMAKRKPMPCMAEAGDFVQSIRKKTQRNADLKTNQTKMQKILMDEVWRKLLNEHETEFDEKVVASLVKQSQYEKQMSYKLLLIKNQKRKLAEDRKIIQQRLMDQRDEEYKALLKQRLEDTEAQATQEECERRVLKKLHRRLYWEKVRLKHERAEVEAEAIVLGLIDIAVRCGEFRAEHGCQVPKRLMKDLKELFIKDLSVFSEVEDVEELKDWGREEEEEEGEVESVVGRELARQDALDLVDSDDYLQLLGPWMVELLAIGPDFQLEPAHVVLGYIVHRLLAVKYPPVNEPQPTPIGPMPVTAVVTGLADEKAVAMLQDLLYTRRVFVVKVPDALNHVLMQYKLEMSVVRDIDAVFNQAGKKAEKQPNKKEELSQVKGKDAGADDAGNKDKQTQTPKVIPDDDPLLTPGAQLGRAAFEALGLGNEVSDATIAGAIASYVASLRGINGWVLLNYPLKYKQAGCIECALTGYNLLPQEPDKEEDTIEDLVGYTPKACADTDAADPFSKRRLSKLVPNSIPKPPWSDPVSYFKRFIKMVKADTERVQDALDKFYTEQRVLFNFEYVAFNYQSMKELARVIFRETREKVGTELVGKSSLEVFGEDLELIEKKWDGAKASGKAPPVVTAMEEDVTESGSWAGELELPPPRGKPPPLPEPPVPGDSDYAWADTLAFEQPTEYQLLLATLWENAEAVFLEDLKVVFFSLRSHRSKIMMYATFVRTLVRSFMRQPNGMQRLLSEFQLMYNDIDADLRPDIDIKGELHVRVSEFEHTVLEVIDKSKAKSVAFIAELVREHWVADELTSLVNHYLFLLQLEADRCVDSCIVLNEYYQSLLGKIPDLKKMDKILIERLPIVKRKYSTAVLQPSGVSLSKGSSNQSFTTTAAEFLAEMLIAGVLPESLTTPYHEHFTDVVTKTKKTLLSMVGGKSTKDSKGKPEGAPTVDQQSGVELATGLNDERARVAFRTDLILTRAILDMDEFVLHMLSLFGMLSDEVGEIYTKRVQNLSNCCKLFRCSIEEEIPIQPLLEFNVDEFIIHHDILLASPPSKAKEPKVCATRFTVPQLSALYDKLYRVAPDGEIVRRAFLYILEDLRAMKLEDGTARIVPPLWERLVPNDLTVLFTEVYQKLEIVNWMDFIIYALEVPFPTEAEVLAMREEFREYDCRRKEVINRDDYNHVPFWFEPDAEVKDLLFRMYQVDDYHTNYSAMLLAFCKDSDPVLGFAKALALATGKKIKIRDYDSRALSEVDHGALGAAMEILEEVLADTIQAAEGIYVKTLPREVEGEVEAEEEPCKALMKNEPVSSSVSVVSEDLGELTPSRRYPSQFSASTISAVSTDVVSSVLLTSYRALPQLSLLLSSEQTLEETLKAVYRSISRCPEAVLAYQLVQHDFIYHLLTCTNKFKSVNIGNVVFSQVQEREGELSACHTP